MKRSTALQSLLPLGIAPWVGTICLNIPVPHRLPYAPVELFPLPGIDQALIDDRRVCGAR